MQIRIDPITGQPVLFATKRAQRPHFGKHQPPHPAIDHHRMRPEHKKLDPFGLGNEHITDPEIWVDTDDPGRHPDSPGWSIRVIPNKYPIVQHHEVIILTSSPSKDIADSSLKHTIRIVEAFVQRTKAHQKQGQVFIFANHGQPAGASISHPHAQLMVFPSLPPTIAEEAIAIKKHYESHGQCAYCQLISRTAEQGKRLVWQNDEFMVICPEASGWPYTMMLLPKIHQASFGSLRPDQVQPLAQALRTMLKLYKSVLQDPPYNYWIHSAKGHFFHWHLELIPRTKILAGVELGAGIMVNDRIMPEDAARQFRLALKDIE